MFKASPTIQLIRERMLALRSLPVMAVLSLVLLFAQAEQLGHTHEADLQAQFDCEICLKLGSLEDAAIADAPSMGFVVSSQSYDALNQNLFTSVPPSATARSPPSYT